MDPAVTQATLDYADARKKMVDGQIRPNKVSDPAILAALQALPRERFVPQAQRARAYADEPVPLGQGRVLPEPRVIARLVQLCAPEPDMHVLVVGAGTGYGAAVLAGCGAKVTALDEDPALLAIARAALAEVAEDVTLAEGPLAAGWGAGAPYDLILIEGAVAEVPPAIAAQLRPGSGRMVYVRAGRGLASQAVIAEVTPAGLRPREAFDCAMPALPSLMPAPGFVF